MLKRPVFNPTVKRYLLLETVTAIAFSVVMAVVVAGSSNEKVSAWSTFSLERYLMLSSAR
jgi:hypothetical protein